MTMALWSYLDDIQQRPFEWGEHDCLTFTNRCWEIVHGRAWSADWLGRYMNGKRPMSRKKLREEFGFTTFAQAVGERLEPVSGLPPRFALVQSGKPGRWAAGIALGFSLGSTAVFVGEHGLMRQRIETVAEAWVQP
jgi:hypothetical protein